MTGRAQLVVSLAVLLAGTAAAVGLVLARPKAAQTSAEERPVPVRVVIALPADARPSLALSGTVEPARRANLQPEVQGRVVAVAPGLDPGVRVTKGQLIVRLDDVRMRAAVAARKAQVAQAELQVREEQTQRRVAEREWKGVELDPSAEAIALRRPHLASAQANLASARAQLAAARRDLAATRIVAPFDAIVLEKHVEVGEVVGPGVPILSLAGTDEAWVRLFVAPEDMRWIELPGPGRAGSPVTIVQADGTVRHGTVARALGSVERRGRQVQLLVRVPDPYDPPPDAGGAAAPLLDGAFVEATVEGRPLSSVYVLPARALVEGDAVWIVGPDDRLQRRPVEIVFRAKNRVFVGQGLEAGDRVVVSPVPTATEGMLVAPEPADAAPGPGGPAAGGARAEGEGA